MQPSGTAKDVPARMNRLIIGDKDPAKLRSEPCWTNEGKDKNELGTFLQSFIYTRRGKTCGTGTSLLVCYAGDRRERDVVRQLQATYKSGHRADLT